VHSEGIRRTELEPISTAHDISAGIVLSELFLHDMQNQPMPDLDFIDVSLNMDGAQGLYWPVVTSRSDIETLY
jgi:hypothetical protein